MFVSRGIHTVDDLLCKSGYHFDKRIEYSTNVIVYFWLSICINLLVLSHINSRVSFYYLHSSIIILHSFKLFLYVIPLHFLSYCIFCINCNYILFYKYVNKHLSAVNYLFIIIIIIMDWSQ